jgi:hypothetical protein
MRFVVILSIMLALGGCQASGNAHSANIMANILTLEF